MASCIGSRLKLKTNDGEYSGILQALGDNFGRVTLQDVTNLQSGVKLKGLLHFFKNEIQEIGVVEGRKETRAVSDDSRGRKIMVRKCNPAHLKKLQDVDREKLFLTGQSSGDETSGNKGPPNAQDTSKADAWNGCEISPEDAAHVANVLGTYIVIDQIEANSFTEAIEHLSQQKLVGLTAEGLKIGRNGQLCWLAFNTQQYTLLFDMISLGKDCFSKGLADILSSHIIQKVIHDCRALSDLLYHQYDIKMVNVFDTQVADNVIFYIDEGCWPHFVPGLHISLFQSLRLEPSLVYVRRYRNEQDDEKVWAMRPASSDTLTALLKSVVFLRRLRLAQMEAMLQNFNKGVDIYLSAIRESSGPEYESKQKTSHQLPEAFKNLSIHQTNKMNDPMLFDENRFYMNCRGVMDPEVRFSHCGIRHKGDGLLPVSFPDNVRVRARARSRECDRTSGHSTSTGRPSSGGGEEKKIIKAEKPIIKKKDNIPKAEPPIPAYTLSPKDDFLLASEAALAPTESGIRTPSQTEVNFIASGYESKVGVPKMAKRVKDPMKKCNFAGNESSEEYHIISTRSSSSGPNSQPKRSAESSPSVLPSIDLCTVPKTNDTPPGPVGSSMPHASPKPTDSPSTIGRGDLLRNLEQLTKSKQMGASPGGLQSRLPKSAMSPESAPGTANRVQESGGQITTPETRDMNGGISMGRGRLKQRYDAL